jgi:hypothetical protein
VRAKTSLPRVGLVTACDDPDLLNFPLWPRQRELLREVEEGPPEHVWALGRRTGKTTLAALVGLWDCLLRPDLDCFVRRWERRHAVAVATNVRQGRLVIQAARSIIEESPLLRPLLSHESEDELRFATGATFSAFPCTSRGGRGWAISTLILDEAAHMLDNDGDLAAENVYGALKPSVAQFGDAARVIASSTPWGAEGWFAEHFQRTSSGELEGVAAHHAATAEVNPTIDRAWLAREERRDPDGFKAEYLARFLGSGSAFFDAEAISAAVTLPGELKPEDGGEWKVGLDPAFAQDTFGLVITGRDLAHRERLLVGCVRAWLPPRRKATSLEEGRQVEDAVLAEVAQVIRLWGATAVTDQFKSAGVVERLRRYGISVRPERMTAPTKTIAFGFLRGRLNEGSIELYEHPGLLRELRSARARYAAGRSSVVLPRVGGSHGDLAQALALSVYEHDRRGLGGRRGHTSGLHRLSGPSGMPHRDRASDLANEGLRAWLRDSDRGAWR